MHARWPATVLLIALLLVPSLAVAPPAAPPTSHDHPLPDAPRELNGPSPRLLILTATGRVFASPLTGDDFRELRPGLSGTGKTFVDLQAGTGLAPHAFALAADGEILRSADGGGNWSRYIPPWGSGPADFSGLAIDAGMGLYVTRSGLQSYQHKPGDLIWTATGSMGNASAAGGSDVAVNAGNGSWASLGGIVRDQAQGLR